MKSIKQWWKEFTDKRERQIIGSIKADANRRYNIIKDGESIYLTMDGTRISDNYDVFPEDYQQACELLFFLRSEYVRERVGE